MTYVLTVDQVTKEYENLEKASSFGKPRDVFIALAELPYMHTGEGKYEVIHMNIPEGTPLAFTGLDLSHLKTQAELLKALKNADIYPFGDSGDFSGKDPKKLVAVLLDKSVVNNAVNPQSALDLLRGLTPQNLGQGTYNHLVDELAGSDGANEAMRLFKDTAGEMQGSFEERHYWVSSIVDGLPAAVRYTRLDEPVGVISFSEDVKVRGANGTEWSVTKDKVLVVERIKDKATQKTGYVVRTVEAATFDNYYRIGDGSIKAHDLVRVDPARLVEPEVLAEPDADAASAQNAKT